MRLRASSAGVILYPGLHLRTSGNSHGPAKIVAALPRLKRPYISLGEWSPSRQDWCESTTIGRREDFDLPVLREQGIPARSGIASPSALPHINGRSKWPRG